MKERRNKKWNEEETGEICQGWTNTVIFFLMRKGKATTKNKMNEEPIEKPNETT